MRAMARNRRRALFTFAVSFCAFICIAMLMYSQGLLARRVDADLNMDEPSIPSQAETMPAQHALMAAIPDSATQPQAAQMPRRVGHGSTQTLAVDMPASMGGLLRATQTDANGNPILAQTYALSVPCVFALGDVPI